MYTIGWCAGHRRSTNPIQSMKISLNQYVPLWISISHADFIKCHFQTIREIAAYEAICKNAREVLKQSLLQRGVSRRPNIDRSKSRAQSAVSAIQSVNNTNCILFINFFVISTVSARIGPNHTWKRRKEWLWIKGAEFWAPENRRFTSNFVGFHVDSNAGECESIGNSHRSTSTYYWHFHWRWSRCTIYLI